MKIMGVYGVGLAHYNSALECLVGSDLGSEYSDCTDSL